MLRYSRYFSILFLLYGCDYYKNPTRPAFNKKNEITIGVLSYSGFDTTLLPFIENEIAGFYKCKTVRLPSEKLPDVAYYKPRNRYKADALLRYQLTKPDNKVDVVVGLTDKDISTSHGDTGDWGVFGLGYLPGKTCIISTKRLISTTNEQFKERLSKVILHELGHNLGLPHCSDHPECMMNDAHGKMTTVDREKKWLCNKCKAKINY